MDEHLILWNTVCQLDSDMRDVLRKKINEALSRISVDLPPPSRRELSRHTDPPRNPGQVHDWLTRLGSKSSQGDLQLVSDMIDFVENPKEEAAQMASVTCHQFIPGFHFECVRELISLYRSGQIAERWPEAVQHGAWFVGCAAAQFDSSIFRPAGEDEKVEIVAGSSIDEASDDLLLSRLEELVPEPGEEVAGISPEMIMMIIEIILRLIERRR